MNLSKIKCNYKDSLMGCKGDGKVVVQLIIHYDLSSFDFDNLFLCKACGDFVYENALNCGYGVLKSTLETGDAGNAEIKKEN